MTSHNAPAPPSEQQPDKQDKKLDIDEFCAVLEAMPRLIASLKQVPTTLNDMRADDD